MQLKTSYFSKTIFLKNITHYWPIWGAYLLICLFQLPFSLYSNLNAQVIDATDIDSYRLSLLQETIEFSLHPFLFFLFACITAISVFSYLYQARSANMIHALPLCRESLFITNVLSGLSFLIIPHIIAFFTGIIVCFLEQITQLEYLLHWLILSCGMVIFAFALSVLTVMITGNILSAPVFFLIFNYWFVGCKMLISGFIKTFSYGIKDTYFSFGDFLSPYYFFVHHLTGYTSLFSNGAIEPDLTKAYTYIMGYFVSSILLFIISFIIYKKKHLETAGDFIAVSFLKPLFRWNATIFLGSGIAVFVQNWINFDNRAGNLLMLVLLFICIGSFVVFFLSEMLIQNNFRVFSIKKFTEWAVIAVLLLAFILGIEYDFFGIETKIPKLETISSIHLDSTYPIDVNAEDFSKVLSLHQTLIDAKKETETYFKSYRKTANSSYVDLTYTLKNGKILSRCYWIPIEDAYLEKEDYVFNLINELAHNPEYYLKYHFTDSYDAITFVEGDLSIYTGSSETDSIILNQEQCIQIYEAFEKDILEGNYRIYDSSIFDSVKDLVYYNTLTFSFYIPSDFNTNSSNNDIISYDDSKAMPTKDTMHWTNITLTTDCLHTLQVLQDMGFINENQQFITLKEAEEIFLPEYYEDSIIY